jgi:4-hydroxybenzoate polyprenyltransferase
LAVAFWVAGFDIIYGSQDYDHDVAHNIHSVPAFFGVWLGLWIAKLCHLLTVLLLVHAGFYLPLGWVYYVGVAIVAGLLFLEHRIISPDDLSRVTVASYHINEIVAPILLVAVLVDIFLI